MPTKNSFRKHFHSEHRLIEMTSIRLPDKSDHIMLLARVLMHETHKKQFKNRWISEERYE